MTQIFDKNGSVHAVTVISAKPVVVTQVKNKESDGYAALQIGEGERNASRINKPMKGHTKAPVNDFTESLRVAAGIR